MAPNFSVEYCVLPTVRTDSTGAVTSAGPSMPSGFSEADCTGEWVTKAEYSDEASTGGLSTSEKYTCDAVSSALPATGSTYIAVSEDTHGATKDIAKAATSQALDVTNYRARDGKDVYVLTLTASEYDKLAALSPPAFTSLQPVTAAMKTGNGIDADTAAVRLTTNADTSASSLAFAISAACTDCEATVVQSFEDGDFAHNEVIVTGDFDVAEILSLSPAITKITPDIPMHTLNADAAWILQSGYKVSSTNPHTPFWDHNIKGQNIIAGVADSGLDYQSCFFYDSSVGVYFSGADSITGKPVFENMSHRKMVQYVAYSDKVEGEDGGHGTHVAGTVMGNSASLPNDAGMAPEAKVAFYDIGVPNAQYLNVPYNLETQMFPYAKRVGAQLHSNSWGGDSNSYSSNSQNIDSYSFANQDFLVLVAAGNSGTNENGQQVSGSLGTPATAKNCVAVGATQNGDEDNDLAYFSSRGPAYDGRIKPDVVAPGYFVDSANSKTSQSPGGHCSTTSMAGTSMATPAVTGVTALAQQYFLDGWYPMGEKNPSDGFKPMGALLKAVLINGAQRLAGSKANWQDAKTSTDGVSNWPNHDQGHGIVELDYTLNFKDAFAGQGLFVRGDFADMPKFTSVSNPDATYQFQSTGTSCVSHDSVKQFRATLAWHDPPDDYLVNDLDLKVTGSDGSTYYPNGKQSRDNVNNAENIAFTPTNGVTYTVSIKPYRINTAYGAQPYAVVVSGCFVNPDAVVVTPSPTPRPATNSPTATPVAVTPSPTPTPPTPTPGNDDNDNDNDNGEVGGEDSEEEGGSFADNLKEIINDKRVLYGLSGVAAIAMFLGLVILGKKAFGGGSAPKRPPRYAGGPAKRPSNVQVKRPSNTRAGGGSFTGATGFTGMPSRNHSSSAGVSMGSMPVKATKYHGKTQQQFNSQKWNDLV
jgi:hypothetical protein